MSAYSPDKLPIKASLSLVFVAPLLWVLPIKDAFQPGGDEGCELLKSFVFSRDFSLYRGLWNDQPPLHTMSLSAVFRVSGLRHVPDAHAHRALPTTERYLRPTITAPKEAHVTFQRRENESAALWPAAGGDNLSS